MAQWPTALNCSREAPNNLNNAEHGSLCYSIQVQLANISMRRKERGLRTGRHIRKISESCFLLLESSSRRVNRHPFKSRRLDPFSLHTAFCSSVAITAPEGGQKSGKVEKRRKHLPSKLLCRETKVLLNEWLISSTRFSKSCLLCWPNLSSISWVQHVFPWGQTRRCPPAKEIKPALVCFYKTQVIPTMAGTLVTVNHLFQVPVFERSPVESLWIRICTQVGENSGENDALSQQFWKH